MCLSCVLFPRVLGKNVRVFSMEFKRLQRVPWQCGMKLVRLLLIFIVCAPFHFVLASRLILHSNYFYKKVFWLRGQLLTQLVRAEILYTQPVCWRRKLLALKRKVDMMSKIDYATYGYIIFVWVLVWVLYILCPLATYSCLACTEIYVASLLYLFKREQHVN